MNTCPTAVAVHEIQSPKLRRACVRRCGNDSEYISHSEQRHLDNPRRPPRRKAPHHSLDPPSRPGPSKFKQHTMPVVEAHKTTAGPLAAAAAPPPPSRRRCGGPPSSRSALCTVVLSALLLVGVHFLGAPSADIAASSPAAASAETAETAFDPPASDEELATLRRPCPKLEQMVAELGFAQQRTELATRADAAGRQARAALEGELDATKQRRQQALEAELEATAAEQKATLHAGQVVEREALLAADRRNIEEDDEKRKHQQQQQHPPQQPPLSPSACLPGLAQKNDKFRSLACECGA